jgi:hypothetical protein
MSEVPPAPAPADAIGDERTVEDRHRLAAWETGRLLNRVLFHLQQAWLLADPRLARRQAARASRLWGLLAFSVRGLSDPVQEKDARCEATLANRRVWEGMFESLGHHESQREAYERLYRRFYDEPDRSLLALQEDICEQLAQPVQELVAELRAAIEHELPGSLCAILRLAEAVDQGLYPRRIYRDLFTSPAESPRPLGWDAPSRSESAADFAPRRAVHRAAAIPDSPWFREVRQRCIDLELSVEGLPTGPGCEDRSCPHATRSLVNEVARRIRETLGTVQAISPLAVSQGPATGGTDKFTAHCRHLGLQVDERVRTVRRDGFITPACFANQHQLWKLFVYFLSHPEHKTGTEWFCEHWERFGKRERCRKNTVYGAIRGLNAMLECIELAVESKVQTGYRITDLHRRDA